MALPVVPAWIVVSAVLAEEALVAAVVAPVVAEAALVAVAVRC